MNKWLEEKRQQILKLSILLIALLLSAYFFLFHTTTNELALKKEMLSTLESEVETLQGKLASLKPDQLGDGTLESLVRGIPNNPNIQQLIASIEQVEQDTSVLIDSISFDLQEGKRLEESFPEQIVLALTETEQELKALQLATVTVQIQFHGAEENIQQFISNLQNTARVTHVTSTNFHKEQDSFQASLMLTAYYSTDFNPYLPEKVAEIQTSEIVSW